MPKGFKQPEVTKDVANFNEQDVATNQTAIPVPIFWGERLCSGIAIDSPINHFTREAPGEKPSKK